MKLICFLNLISSTPTIALVSSLYSEYVTYSMQEAVSDTVTVTSGMTDFIIIGLLIESESLIAALGT